MWNNFSITQFVPSINLSGFLPAVPDRFFSSVGSSFLAAAMGGTYGLLGRVIYPNAGISPLHYAVWFVLAFQIKQFVLSVESKMDRFLSLRGYLEKLEDISEDQLDLHDLIGLHCWRVIHLKSNTVKVVDGVFSKLLNIRPYEKVTVDNVEGSSFLEMCRYRIWPVFKLTVLDTVTFAVAYHFSNYMGFALPNRTAVPLLIVIRSVVEDIILIPALYVYARFCNRVADDLGEGDANSSAHRAKWIRLCLPTL